MVAVILSNSKGNEVVSTSTVNAAVIQSGEEETEGAEVATNQHVGKVGVSI